jgi:hypothetical protein
VVGRKIGLERVKAKEQRKICIHWEIIKYARLESCCEPGSSFTYKNVFQFHKSKALWGQIADAFSFYYLCSLLYTFHTLVYACNELLRGRQYNSSSVQWRWKFNHYVIISKYLHFFMFIVVYEVYFSLSVCIIDPPSSHSLARMHSKGEDIVLCLYCEQNSGSVSVGGWWDATSYLEKCCFDPGRILFCPWEACCLCWNFRKWNCVAWHTGI